MLFLVISGILLTGGMNSVKNTRYLSRLQVVPIGVATQGDYLFETS
ncbi:hypothetical protein [Marinicellulosiphila megalodicopiae]